MSHIIFFICLCKIFIYLSPENTVMITKREKILFFATCFISILCHAQAGINNANPQQALHISGTGTGISQPIIQNDGFSLAQNSAHESSDSQKRVFATSDGDLLILPNKDTNVFYISPQIAKVNLSAGTETSISSYTFTLEYPSAVHFEARPTFFVDTATSTEAVRRSGQSRQVGFYFKFTSAPSGVTINKSFGNSYVSWASYSATNADDQLYGDYIFNPKKDLVLPKGIYTVALYGFVQNSDVGFITNQINQTTQTMRVSISPVSY